MDDDDDFGDLYSDVLRPIPSLPSKPPSSLAPQPAAQPPPDDSDDWILGGAAPPVDPPANWDEDDEDGGGGVPDAKDDFLGESGGAARVLKEDGGGVSMSGGEDGDLLARGGASGVSGDPDHEMVIPGLSAGPAKPSAEAKQASNAEDWDSDSEDDLQIVLNDTRHGQFGGDMNGRIGVGEDDDYEDEEEDLVIVTDDDQHRHIASVGDEQDWGEETMPPGVDGEGKELGDAAKSIGASAGARIGYSGPGFHPQHHAMFKYIRPGATPNPVTGTVGPAGALRPPLPLGSMSGRGRGDGRPAGGRGYIPSWANNQPARSFGGLDFTLPSHKTVFDVNIESFEEKPWRYPGVDISDFFNFGLDEDKWKNYCKQLDQLRLESTMQSKIRVYESGRSEQEYDPDLPPELAAAAGNHDISVDNGHTTHTKSENAQADYSGQGIGGVVMHAPLPTGRPIPVETGSGERLPSIDTRPPRMRDADCVIEIPLGDFFGDPEGGKSEPEKSDNNLQGVDDKGFPDGIEEEKNAAPDDSNISSCPPSSRNNERSRRISLAPDGDDVSSFPSESSAECNLKSRARSPRYSGRTSRKHHQGRLPQGPSHVVDPKSPECLSGAAVNQNTDSNRLGGHKEDKDADKTETVEDSDKPPVANEPAKLLNVDNHFDEEDGKLALLDSIDIDGDDIASDHHVSSETIGDDNVVSHEKRQKLCSQVEPSVHQTSEELRTSNSENSISRSANSRDHMRHRRNEEVVQKGHKAERSDLRKSYREDHNYWQKDDYIHDTRQTIDQHRVASRRREEMLSQSHSHRNFDLSEHPAHGRSFERMKGIDASSSAWQKREASLLSRRIKDEDIWWENNSDMTSRHKGKMKAGERNQRDDDLYSRKHVEDVEWRGHTKDSGTRTRERDDISLSHQGLIDEAIKRKRDDEYLKRKSEKDEFLRGHRNREDPGRRKRDKDDITERRRREDGREDIEDHRRREDSARMRDKAVDHYPGKHNDGSWYHMERDDKQRIKQSYESVLINREREEVRNAGRSGRGVEDKTISGNARTKEGSAANGSDKEPQDRDRRRSTEHLRKGDRYREENLPQHNVRGNNPSREKLVNNDDRGSRPERQSMYDGRPSNASDNQQFHRERSRENTRKSKDSELEEQKVQVVGKRKYEDQGDRHNEKVSAKVLCEENSNASGNVHKNDQNLNDPLAHPDRFGGKQRADELVSDDDTKETSRRGRSKLERWTSHKDKDDNKQTLPPSRPKVKEVGGNNDDAAQNEDLANPKAEPCDDTSGLDAGQIGEKTIEDQDRHLDTVAKLKRRSERFKLPMPGEKDSPSSKKMENEVHLSHADASATATATASASPADTDVKPERTARKRRWTGS